MSMCPPEHASLLIENVYISIMCPPQMNKTHCKMNKNVHVPSRACVITDGECIYFHHAPPANEQNTLHWHSNAMISGVYYIQNEPGAGDIVFQKSHLYYNLFHDTVRVSFKEPTQYNTNEFYISPKSGDLVMFPSHLEHMVTPNLTTTPRYSLAFNFFARGTVGGGTSELKL